MQLLLLLTQRKYPQWVELAPISKIKNKVKLSRKKKKKNREPQANQSTNLLC